MNNEKAWCDVYENTNYGNLFPSSYLVSLVCGKIRGYLKKKERIRVLDFGCGLGTNSKMLEKLGFDVYGIDISSEAIKKCIERNNFAINKFIAMDILKDEIPFKYKFDLIVANAVMYYFDIKSEQKILDIFKSMLTADGILYTNWVTYNHPYYRNYMNVVPDEFGMIAVEKSGSASLPLTVKIVKDRSELYKIFSNYKVLDILRTVEEIDGECESLHVLAQNIF